MKKATAFLLLLSAFGCSYETEEQGTVHRTVLATDPCPTLPGDNELTGSHDTERTPSCFYRLGDCTPDPKYAHSFAQFRESTRSYLDAPDEIQWSDLSICTTDGLVLRTMGSSAGCPETRDDAPLLAMDERPTVKTCDYDVTYHHTNDPMSCGGMTGDPLQ